MINECAELHRLVQQRATLEISDLELFRRDVRLLSRVETCIADGLRQTFEHHEWRKFEVYVYVASLHPSKLYTPILCNALRARSDRYSSEYVVDTLGESRDEAAIECLERALWWHREWDEFHNLAIKCVWALAWINTTRSRTVMARAAQLAPALISEWASSDGRGPTLPERQIRASFDQETITVYQAFSPEIADATLAAGKLQGPFSLQRMTWIKPSFMWMMYRSGWATKQGQERVLAIRIRRDAFDNALAAASLTAYDPQLHPSYEKWQLDNQSSTVKVQWDPDRTVRFDRLPWRCIQIGLAPPVVAEYANDWIVDIEDVTTLARALHDAHVSDTIGSARHLFPAEYPYPVPTNAAPILGISAHA